MGFGLGGFGFSNPFLFFLLLSLLRRRIFPGFGPGFPGYKK